MDVIWGKKVEREEPKGGHRVLFEVMGMLYSWTVIMIAQLCKFTEDH